MPNPYVNKVVIDGVTKLDLTADTALASDVAQGKYFHLASGEKATGTLASGDSLGYGTGDATRPIVGIGTVNSMVI